MRRFLLTVVLLVAVSLAAGCAALTGGAGKTRDIPGEDLFAQYDWAITSEVHEGGDKLPVDFKLRSGFPWVIYLDLSRDVGLDFAAHAGEPVRTMRFSVTDRQGKRLQDIAAKYDLQGVVLLNEGGQVIGAWLTYTAKDGTVLMGSPGYSLRARDLEQVTGMAWPEYATRRAQGD